MHEGRDLEKSDKLDPAQNSVVSKSDTEHGLVDGKVLYLYSGPRRPSDGLGRYLKDRGIEAAYVDREINELHDLLDQDVWERIESNLSMYDGYMISPPCSTFSPARQGMGGPQPLRSTKGPEVYGLKDLAAEDKQKAREGNILALRAHRTALHAHRSGKPWLLEQPHERKEKTSMFKLDEYKTLIAMDGVLRYTFAQCRFGAPSEKLTDLLSNVEGLSEFTVLCNHPSRWWRIPWNGRWIYAAHPPLKGKQRAIPAEQWRPAMIRAREPQGEYLTRQAAAYPKELNEALAAALAGAISKMKDQNKHPADNMDNKRPASATDWDPKPQKAMRLSGQAEQHKKQDDVRNSLRNVQLWITDRMRYIGVQVRNIIEKHLDGDQDAEDQLWQNIAQHQSQEDVIIPEQAVSLMRQDIKEMLIRNSSGGLPSDLSIDPVDSNSCTTVIRAYLLEAWAQVVEDPAAATVSCLYAGAPAGLHMQSESLDGVFPRVDDDIELLDVQSLATDFDSFSNYVGVEEDSEALETLESYHRKGYLSRYDSLEELEAELGDKPVLSKLACLKKLKYNPDTGQYISKSRIILDCRRSGVSLTSVRTHKSVLPRITDAVNSALTLMDRATEDQRVTMFIADIVDAFWLIPLHPKERKFFCAKLRGKFYLFTRTAQGSRMAPLTFAAIMALASRWIQSLSDEFQLQTYVDDPLVIIKGIRRLAVIIAAAWQIMGFPLAFHKATLSDKLTWIGVQLEICEASLIAEVTEAKVGEISQLLTEALKHNLVSVKCLRTIIGKCMSIASVIVVWRPFVQQLYTALHAEETHAPSGCVWTKQIESAIHWLLTFLKGEQAGICRKFTLAAFRRQGPVVVITWDASPYGMGATLQIQGQFVEFFAVRISQADQDILGVQAGDCKGQQVWEALAGLIALRQWAVHWQHTPVVLQIRNDNVGALSLFANLKAGSRALNLIAREFALDLGQATCRPQLVTHIPGLTNTVCDALSRINDPAKQFKPPVQLSGAKAVLPCPRRTGWWRTLPHRLVLSPASQLQTSHGERHQLALTPRQSAG